MGGSGGSSSEAKPSVAPRLIEAMTPEDWTAVREIYEQGIATGNATFETEVPDWKAWDEAHLPDHRFVARVQAAGVP